MKCGRRGKPSPRYIKTFEILQKFGEVGYELALPPTFSSIHPIFHVLMLHRYISNESHVLLYDAVQLDNYLTFTQQPLAILAGDVRRLRSRAIPFVKVCSSRRYKRIFLSCLRIQVPLTLKFKDGCPFCVIDIVMTLFVIFVFCLVCVVQSVSIAIQVIYNLLGLIDRSSGCSFGYCASFNNFGAYEP